MQDIQLTASLPGEMVQSQQTLIAWMDKKIAVCAEEEKELFEAYEHAKKQAWKWTVIKRHADLARKRTEYYIKIKAALENGYYIVPNFPIELFAIRTDKKNPLKMISIYQWGNSQRQQSAMELPAGKGEYKNPRPITDSQDHERMLKDGKTDVVTNYWAEDWQEIEFPITMAKPEIMELTSRAMALEVFDQIGILPGVRKNDDPVIIGQIIRKFGNQTKIVSFMIAWHLNTNMI